MPDLILYHVPPSFYSQIARLGLRELGVPFLEKVVAPGPPTFESYAPWYMALNPMGTVPTLLHGDQAVPDSEQIIRYAEANLSEETLTPTHPLESEKMEEWIQKLGEVPIRELSYGADNTRSLGQRVNRMRLKNLSRRKEKNPALASMYERKLEDISGFSQRAMDPKILQAHLERVDLILDEMDHWLKSHLWLAGDSYSLADTVWTVGVARLRMLHLEPLTERVHLADWYERVRSRPSFEAADVWERFKPEVMVKVLVKKFGPRLFLGAAGLFGVGYLILFLF